MEQTLFFFLPAIFVTLRLPKPYIVVQALDAFLLDDSPVMIRKVQFEEALNTPDPKEGLQRLIDPALGEDYPIDSILKVSKTTPTHK